MTISTISKVKKLPYNKKKCMGSWWTMIDYSPLWETMKRKGITQYRLLKSGIDNKTPDSVKKGNNITLLTLEKLCIALDCTPNDVVRFQK